MRFPSAEQPDPWSFVLLALALLAGDAGARKERGAFEAGPRREAPPRRATLEELEARANEQAMRVTVPNGARLSGTPCGAPSGRPRCAR